MGIAIAVVYLPILVAVVAATAALSIVPLRAESRFGSISFSAMSIAYFGGALVTILVTIAVGWWYSRNEANEWAALTHPIAISLIGPPIIGLALLSLAWITQQRHLHYMTAGALHSTIVVPIVAVAILASYDNVVYKPTFTELCNDAQVKIVETIAPAKSVALLPDSFLTSNAKGHGTQSLRAALLCNYDLELVEAGLPGPAGAQSYVAMTLASNPPNCSARGQVAENSATSLTAEYRVSLSTLPIASDVSKRMHGQRIEIRRSADQALVAIAQYYWDDQKFWECPVGVGQPGFIRDFVVRALNVSRR